MLAKLRNRRRRRKQRQVVSLPLPPVRDSAKDILLPTPSNSCSSVLLTSKQQTYTTAISRSTSATLHTPPYLQTVDSLSPYYSSARLPPSSAPLFVGTLNYNNSNNNNPAANIGTKLSSSPPPPRSSTTAAIPEAHHQPSPSCVTIDAKVVLVGSQAVGKTSIARRFVDRAFFGNSIQSTVGASLMTKRISIGNRTIRLQLWDTAGQDRFRSMAPLFFRGSHAAICVYDISSEKSFDDLQQWINDLQRYSVGVAAEANNGATSDGNREECQLIYVVGNKSDLAASGSRAVDWHRARLFVDSMNAIASHDIGCGRRQIIHLFPEEISAKSDGGGVDRLFHVIASKLLDNLGGNSSHQLQRNAGDAADDCFQQAEFEKHPSAANGAVPVVDYGGCAGACGVCREWLTESAFCTIS